MMPKNAVKTEYALLALPAVEPLQQLLKPIIAKTETYAITSDAEFAKAGYLLEAIKHATCAVQAAYADTINAWFQGHRTATAARKTFLDVLGAAETKVKIAWSQYKRRKDDEATAERCRLEEEARKQAEQARLDTAIAMEAAGQQQEAEAILNDPTPAIIVTPEVKVPEVKGIGVTQRWYAEVTDLKALVLAVAAGQVPLSMLQADQKSLDQFAQATSGKMVVAGVRFYPKDVVSNRR